LSDSSEETRISSNTQRVDAPKEASLVQIYGPTLGHRFVIDKPVLTIGRDAGNDIVLDSNNVSRFHARVRADGSRVFLEDLDSTNGSLVNDEEVTKRALDSGDIIKIGSVLFKFITGGNAEAAYHEEIYRLTIHDGLTGIPNRRCLEEFLERELARAQRYQRPMSLAIFDIDHFKKINDKYGHLAGDYVLRRMAGKIKKLIRREELFARYGGEEFVVVMPETPAERAARFAEKMREVVETSVFEFDTERIPVTISVGVAALESDIEDSRKFIAAADAVLYEAKRSGRNRVLVAGQEEASSES